MFENKIIDKILNLIPSKKTKKEIILENNTRAFFMYNEKKRLETEEYIMWFFTISNEEYSVKYYKNTNKYLSKSNNNNKLLCLNIANYNCKYAIYINEKQEYELISENHICIFIFLFGIKNNDIMKYNNIANNFFDKFILSCEKINKNIYSFPTEVKEFNLDKVTFEFNEEKNKIVDEYTIKWNVIVIIESDNKIIKSERFLGYDYIDNYYFCDTQYKKPMSDISYLYDKWCDKYSVNLGFNDEFYIYLNYKKIEDKIFRLKTVNPYFAFMTFINAKYEDLCKIQI